MLHETQLPDLAVLHPMSGVFHTPWVSLNQLTMKNLTPNCTKPKCIKNHNTWNQDSDMLTAEYVATIQVTLAVVFLRHLKLQNAALVWLYFRGGGKNPNPKTLDSLFLAGPQQHLNKVQVSLLCPAQCRHLQVTAELPLQSLWSPLLTVRHDFASTHSLLLFFWCLQPVPT